MKEILFVLMLAMPQGQLPPITEPMPTIQACQERVEKALHDFESVDEDFVVRVGCFVRSKKADPA